MSILKLVCLGVGHGDATLIQWLTDDPQATPTFTCLIDSGESPELLEKALDRNRIGTLDLLIVTHFDSDHIGGLEGVSQYRQVSSYWGPCLPAFYRHAWLFGDRGLRAVERARSLEKSLADSGSSVLYPLEGFAAAPATNLGPTIHVLSPPAKIIRTLLVSDDVEWLFTETPTPLGWLAEPDELPVDQPSNQLALDQQLLSSALLPEDLTWIQDSPRRSDATAIHREWGPQHHLEPQFFGDSILNNTSIVLWFDAETGGRRHRILMTGDQENWTYLLLRHPLGMQADVLKAPHHGGQLYIERDCSHEEILSTVRPRVMLLSANGRHGLPHSDVRASAIRWGDDCVLHL